MAMSDKEVRLNSRGREGSPRRVLEAQDDLNTDVRSTVESQFQQMEQAHDRIRIEELAARLATHTIN